MSAIENRATRRRSALADVTCAFCGSHYDNVYVSLVGEVILYPSLSALSFPHPWRHRYPYRSHPVTLRPTTIYLCLFPLSSSLPRFSLSLFLSHSFSPFISLAYTLSLSVTERIANLARVDTPLSLLTRFCHLDRPCAVHPRTHGLAHTYAKIARKRMGRRERQRERVRRKEKDRWYRRESERNNVPTMKKKNRKVSWKKQERKEVLARWKKGRK